MSTLKLIDSLEELAQYRDQWNHVVADNPFLRAEWMFSWMEHMAAHHRPAILVDDSPTGWKSFAPFCVEEGPGGRRKLKFMSCGTACADYLDLVSPPQQYNGFADLVVDWLKSNTHASDQPHNERWQGFDSIELDGVAANSRTVTGFVAKLESAGFRCHCAETEGCWSVPLPDSWETLNAQFSKKHRRKTRKAIQRLNSDEITVRSTPQLDIDDLWPTFVRMHQMRRRAVGQPGCFSDPNFERFLYQAVDQMIRTDHARMFVLCFHQQPFASALVLNSQHQAMMYQTGMNPEHSKLEPGYQLIVTSMQHAMEQGKGTFDFLRGDEPYKARWNTKRVPLVRIRLVPPKLGSIIRHQLWVSGWKIKNYATQAGLLGS